MGLNGKNIPIGGRELFRTGTQKPGLLFCQPTQGKGALIPLLQNMYFTTYLHNSNVK